MERTELSDYGIRRMDADEMTEFLSGQSVGVLALPADGAPAMRPMSYWFDGESTIYFLYVLGPESEKEALTAETDLAQFLVYSAETPFTWRSVLLTGEIAAVPPDERDAIETEMELAWQPAVFEQVGAATATDLYAFEVADRDGLKHLGLPPGIDESPG